MFRQRAPAAAGSSGDPAQADGLGNAASARGQDSGEQQAAQQRDAAVARAAGSGGGANGGAAPAGRGYRRSSAPGPVSLLADQVTQAAITAGMVVVVSLGPHWQPATVLLLMCAAWGVMASWPGAYWRNRTSLLPVLRCIILVVPSIRSAGVGYGITRSLDRPAAHGLLGALVDFLRLSTASRLLPWAVQSHFMLLPPAACLITHVCLTLFSSNLGGICATQMLSDALARRRQAVSATVLDVLALPVVALMPAAGPLSMEVAAAQGVEGEEAVCRSTLLFLQIFLGVLIPLATSCYLWPLPPAPPRPAAPVAAAAAPAARRSAPGRVGHAVQRGAAAVDAWLPWLLGVRPSRVSAIPVLVYICGCCWVLCRMHTGLF